MSRISQPARDAAATEWNVYGDALQEAGDPRGELIALNAAVAKGMAPTDRDTYVERHKAALFGGAAAHGDAFRVTWHHSLPDTVEIRIAAGDAAPAIVEGFLASPLAEAAAVTLVGVPAAAPSRTPVDLSGAVALFLEKLPASVRSLRFVDERATQTTLLASRDFPPGDNLVNFGDLSPVWGKAQLVDVALDVADTNQLALGDIDAPHLQRFALRGLNVASPGNDTTIIERLAQAKFRDLRSCELRLVEEFGANIIADEDAYIPRYATNENYEDRMDEAESEGEQWGDVNWAPLRPLFETLAKCPLERLALTSFASWNNLSQVLAETGFAPGLQVLDLSDATIPTPDWLLANRHRLPNLKRLMLERTSLSAEDAAQLAGAGYDVAHSTAYGSPTYRYIVGQE